jgi:hypothetical protein
MIVYLIHAGSVNMKDLGEGQKNPMGLKCGNEHKWGPQGILVSGVKLG